MEVLNINGFFFLFWFCYQEADKHDCIARVFSLYNQKYTIFERVHEYMIGFTSVHL